MACVQRCYRLGAGSRTRAPVAEGGPIVSMGGNRRDWFPGVGGGGRLPAPSLPFAEKEKLTMSNLDIESGLVSRSTIVYPIGLRMNTKKRLSAVLMCCLLSVLILQGMTPAKKKIVISLEKKEIRQMDASGLILVFYLAIANDERSPFSLVEYDYRVVVQNTDYFALRTALEEPIPVAGKATTRISLPLKITYSDLLERVPAADEGPKAQCYVTGLMIFADSRGRQEKIPFAFSGEFPVYRPLEVEIRPLEVKTLTIGGADFTVVFACRNRNDFEMVFGRMFYRLGLDGRTIAEGVVAPGKKIESRGEIIFSLPHMLEFFEVGREVYDVMQKPSASGELSIQTRAESVWGEIDVNSGDKGDVQIVRSQ